MRCSTMFYYIHLSTSTALERCGSQPVVAICTRREFCIYAESFAITTTTTGKRPGIRAERRQHHRNPNDMDTNTFEPAMREGAPTTPTTSGMASSDDERGSEHWGPTVTHWHFGTTARHGCAILYMRIICLNDGRNNVHLTSATMSFYLWPR